MRILAIETSCDETALSLLNGEDSFLQVEKSVIASQIQTHAKYGGVVPEVAAREHMKALFPLLASVGVPRDGKGIDAIAVTYGPGLVVALRLGVEVAKTLSYAWNKPLVGVNHLEGHVYSAFLGEEQPLFPLACLLVSGGHTELVFMKDHGNYELIGMTRDDAAGEAFDKVAHLLGLGYPGGPVVSQEAMRGNGKAILFPRPMLDQPNFDFSFAGLKTAVLIYVKKMYASGDALSLQMKQDICASFQEAVVDTLVSKTLRATEKYLPRSVILTGGVSANRYLRDQLMIRVKERYPDISVHVAPMAYTTDNAAMIAVAGYFHAQKKEFHDPLTLRADPNLRLASLL